MTGTLSCINLRPSSIVNQNAQNWHVISQVRALKASFTIDKAAILLSGIMQLHQKCNLD
jgi:hypothetical protein